MDKLKKFLSMMSVPERDRFAKRCGTSAAHLRNIVYGFRSANERLSNAIERESNGAVTRRDLRPLDYMHIWPDLIEETTP